jgi:hypothetical protein
MSTPRFDPTTPTNTGPPEHLDRNRLSAREERDTAQRLALPDLLAQITVTTNRTAPGDNGRTLATPGHIAGHIG